MSFLISLILLLTSHGSNHKEKKDGCMSEQPMLKFVSLEREMPQKRLAGERAQDFSEIYAEFAREKAAEQASRCSQCGVPYCQSHCPLHNNIPDWLMLTLSLIHI